MMVYIENLDDDTKRFIQSVFLSELSKQCDFASYAMNFLRSALHSGERDSTSLTFFAAHTFLTHAGNISKLLWPDKRTKNKWPNSYERGKELRRILVVHENSPLKDRTLRNHFEHYDSRIDEWVFDSINRKHAQSVPARYFYADSVITRARDVKRVITGLEIEDVMRHFDPETFTLSFRGERYNLLSTEKEIIELHKKISKFLEREY
jgi:hypothetical protein